MKKEWFKEYSECLNRDMKFMVYGHAGQPMLVFPSQDGRYFDFENNCIDIYLQLFQFQQQLAKRQLL